jgi:hypothetical protein
MKKLENFLIAFYGIMTVAVFLLMVVWGGLFDSIHTLLFKEVSFLISPYSLTESTTVPLYKLYNTNLLLFSIVLLFRLRNVFAKVGALYLAMSSVTGLLLLHVPLDPIHLAKSFSGSAHIGVALLTAFFILVALALFGYSFKKDKKLAVLSKYSFLICCIILVAGFLTGVFAMLSLPIYVGFTEKLPIVSFLLWIVVTAVWMLHTDKSVRISDKNGKKRVRRGSN